VSEYNDSREAFVDGLRADMPPAAGEDALQRVKMQALGSRRASVESPPWQRSWRMAGGLAAVAAVIAVAALALAPGSPADRASVQGSAVATRFAAYQLPVKSGGGRSPSRVTSVTVYDLPEATKRAGFDPPIPKSNELVFQGAEVRAIPAASDLYGGSSSLVLHYEPDVALLIVPFSSEGNALKIKASLFSADAEQLYLKHADLSEGITADYLTRGNYEHPDGHFSEWDASLVVWVDGSTYYLLSSPTLPVPALLAVARSVY